MSISALVITKNISSSQTEKKLKSVLQSDLEIMQYVENDVTLFYVLYYFSLSLI